MSEPTSGLPGGVYMDTDTACLSSGRFVVAWRDGRNGANGDIYAAILQNNHWVYDPLIPMAGPVALVLLAGGLGWTLRRNLTMSKSKRRG